MKPFFSWSLRTHLFLLVLGAVLPALAIILYTGGELRRQAIQEAQERALHLTQNMANLEARVEDNTRMLLATLARVPAVQQLDRPAINALLANLLQQHPAYATFALATADGRLYASAVPFTSVSISDRKYFQDAVKHCDFSIGEYAISRTTQVPALHFGYPVMDAQGELKGVILAAFNLAYYSTIFTQAKLPPQSYLKLMDHKGVGLYRYPDTDGLTGRPEPPESLALLTDSQDEGTYMARGDDGRRRLFAYKRLRLKENPESFLIIQIGIPEEEALAEARLVNRHNLVWLGLTTTLALALAWLLGNYLIMGRLNRLVTASQRWGGGNLEARSGLAYDQGELGQLAKSFDDMAQSLEKRETARQEAVAALALEKERLRVTLRSIGDGVIATDTDGRVVLMNNVAETLTGWGQQEAQGKPLDEVFVIINEKTRQPCDNPATLVMASGKVVGLANHTVLISREGTERVLADSGAPIVDADQRVIGVVLVFQDVTEKHRMEEEFFRMEKLRSLGVLAGGIAHDFNNILTGILGSISLARLSLPDELEPRVRLKEAEQATLRARDLVLQLLTFAKGGSPITENVDLNRIIRESAQFACSGSAVQCDFSLSLDLWLVHGDPGQLSQVVQNLVLNAVQSMPEGGTIRIQAENVAADGNHPVPPGKYVRVDIQDSGIGIPPEHLPRVFDPFFTTKPRGSGLGLATVHSIIQHHEGHIGVNSQPGKGTTFSLYLPASEQKPEALPAREERLHSGGGKILIMDDEELVREVMGQMLLKLGYTVSFAADGTEALHVYQQARDQGEPFAAVIMDLTIPGGMGGKEAIGQLLQLDPQAKAIVSSGYSDDPIMSDYRAFGFTGVIAKPYKISDLSAVLQQVLAS